MPMLFIVIKSSWLEKENISCCASFAKYVKIHYLFNSKHLTDYSSPLSDAKEYEELVPGAGVARRG